MNNSSSWFALAALGLLSWILASAAHADPGDAWNLPAAGSSDFTNNPWMGSGGFGSTAGNPYGQAGSVSAEQANWYAVYQATPGAQYNDPYAKMYYADQFSYAGDTVWSGDPDTAAFDPHPNYGRNFILSAASSAGTPNSNGSAAGLFFQAPESGTFSINIAGLVSISASTAGWADIEIFTLNGSFAGDTFTATGGALLQQSVIDPNGVSGTVTSTSFSYTGSLSLNAGEIFGLRIYDVAPGLNPSGPASIDFSGGAFSITETSAVPEPSPYTLLAAGAMLIGLAARIRLRAAR